MALTGLRGCTRVASDKDKWRFVYRRHTSDIRHVCCWWAEPYTSGVFSVDLEIYVRCVVSGLSDIR